MSNPDPAWSLGADDDFVLEDDDTFGLGELEGGGELPPFDEAEAPLIANKSAPELAGEDPFGLSAATPLAHAAPHTPIMNSWSR